MYETKPTIYPTLVIGLGGTGTNVVRYVKRRFLNTWQRDEADDLPAILQVLAVDTEPLVNAPGEEPLYFNEFAFLGNFDATRLVQNRRHHSPYLDWWQWDEGDLPLGYIHNGAKQLRPIGRLAFFRNYVTFKTLLVDKLRSMRELKAIQEAQERGFPVAADYRLIYIITSLCGGTGAGMFLDVAHRVRHEVGSNANIIGVFLMPSIFEKEIQSDLQRRRIQANAYAALKELNHFHETQDFRAHYPSEQGPLPTTRYRAFNQIFLVERTNAAGRTLSSKAAAEQMVAHLVYLTAFSHLNKRILGLDVNVTEERAAEIGGDQRRYLSYSSFSVSALVMPRSALWKYFASVATYWAMEDLLLGGHDELDVARAWEEYKLIRDEIRREFMKYHQTEEDLRALEAYIVHKDGPWLRFVQIVSEGLRRILVTHGLEGARYVIHRLTLDEHSTELDRQDLAHPSQQPFEEAPEVPKGGFLEVFLSPEVRASRELARRERRLFELRLTIWKNVLVGIQSLARDLEGQIDQIEQAARDAQDVAWREAMEAAKEVDPLVPNSGVDTSTYYDLETGAVSPGHLEAYLEKAMTLMSEPIAEEEESPTAWEVLLRALYDRLLPEGAQEFHVLGEAALRSAVSHVFSEDLEVLRRKIMAAFDLRDVIQVQHGDGYRPPNFRIDQIFQRLAPHATVDGDTYPYSEANEEHTRLIGVPFDLERETGDASRTFRQAMRGYSQFEWVETGDPDRIDACHIVHGLPLSQLESMPELYSQYWSREFVRRVLHIRPEWENLPEVYVPPVPAGAEAGPSSALTVDATSEEEGSTAGSAKRRGRKRKGG